MTTKTCFVCGKPIDPAVPRWIDKDNKSKQMHFKCKKKHELDLAAQRDIDRQNPDYDPTGDGDWNETTNLY